MMNRSCRLVLFLVGFLAAIPSVTFSETGEVQAALQKDPSGLSASSPAERILVESRNQEEITVVDLFKRTGYFIYPLGLFSVWALYLILANLFILSESRLVPKRIAFRLREALGRGDLKEAGRIVVGRRDLLSLMVQAGLGKAGREPGLIETAMEGSISREMAVLRNRIRRLADIGNLAPMLGLLGTVWGMILVFKAISIDPNAMVANWSSVLAEGVAQAMLTTVAGLVIGIPSLFFYYIYRNKMARIVGRLESHGTDLADLLSQIRRPAATDSEKTVLMEAQQ